MKNKPKKRSRPTKNEIVFNLSDYELKGIASLRKKSKIECLAPLNKRAGAFLLNYTLVFPLWFIHFVVSPQYQNFIEAISVVVFLIWLVTNLPLLLYRGQSVGKYLLDIQLLDAKTGDPSTWEKILFVRPLFSYLTFMPKTIPHTSLEITLSVMGLMVCLLDVSFIFRKDRRCLHDLIAGTVVVNCDDAAMYKTNVMKKGG